MNWPIDRAKSALARYTRPACRKTFGSFGFSFTNWSLYVRTSASSSRRIGLSRLPRHIEGYDVSTFAGTLTVASRVVFRDGQPTKADFRRYRIREAAPDVAARENGAAQSLLRERKEAGAQEQPRRASALERPAEARTQPVGELLRSLLATADDVGTVLGAERVRDRCGENERDDGEQRAEAVQRHE